MQGYESYVWNVLFSMDVYFPNLSCSLEAYNKFLRNFPHVYISGILLDRFLSIFWYFLYYFVAKSKRIGQKFHHNTHYSFSFKYTMVQNYTTYQQFSTLGHCVICTTSTQSKKNSSYVLQTFNIEYFSSLLTLSLQGGRLICQT